MGRLQEMLHVPGVQRTNGRDSLPETTGDFLPLVKTQVLFSGVNQVRNDADGSKTSTPRRKWWQRRRKTEPADATKTESRGSGIIPPDRPDGKPREGDFPERDELSEKVIRITGEEMAVDRINLYLQSLAACAEIRKKGDPFKNGQKESGILDDETKAVLRQIKVNSNQFIETLKSDYQDPAKLEKLEASIKESGNFAKQKALEPLDALKLARKTTRDQLTQKSNEIKDYLRKDDEPIPPEAFPDFTIFASRASAKLQSIAAEMPTATMIGDLHTLLVVYDNSILDRLILEGAKSKPELVTDINNFFRRNHSKLPANTVKEEKLNLFKRLDEQGQTTPQGKLLNKDLKKCKDDMKDLDDLNKSFEVRRQYGTDIYNLLTTVIRINSTAAIPVPWDLLVSLQDKLDLSTGQDGTGLSPEDAATIEEYIAMNTSQLENIVKDLGHKFKSEYRRNLHRLKDKPNQRSINKKKSTSDTREVVLLDETFIQSVRKASSLVEAKFKQGEPARPFADRLFRYERKDKTKLAPAERGLLAALASDTLDLEKMTDVENIQSVLDNFKESESEQVRALRQRYPERYTGIENFIKYAPENEEPLQYLISNLRSLTDNQEVIAALGGSIDQNQKAALASKLRKGIDKIDDYLNPKKEVKPDEEARPQLPVKEEEEIFADIQKKAQDISKALGWNVFEGDRETIIHEIPAGTPLEKIKEQVEETLTLAEKTIRKNQPERFNWNRIKTLMDLVREHEGKLYRSDRPILNGSYLVGVMTYNGHEVAIAEHPIIGNATYLIAPDLADGSWQDITKENRYAARVFGARQVIHPTEKAHKDRIVYALDDLTQRITED